MTREEMRYKLNELRMMLNDGEHGEEQGVLVEIISELDKWEEPPIYTLTSNNLSALSENKGENKSKGHWIYYPNNYPYIWKCDKCESLFKIDFNFCPRCGEDMRGE